MASKPIIVTGSNGFLGSNFIFHMLDIYLTPASIIDVNESIAG
ncbi:dTDP-D-glucose 4,6-dehydratase [Clostridium tetanomorphum]|nr:hypothetical protein CTM_25364 [Clostridium tetanomorphum DSM 665]KAJ52113.1 hypothetical protein CTM_10081 [Clostridium tetanomorphum DSM 665]MBP1863035.1 dTDP-D-glucose 4,6-dehydratase [Clostridium tetanomorphum]NRS82864.1 dTDP-D-glucose 4,6-dehydratase [Clostridium tetanomorphum]SQC03231.1 Uncharacterised protein [Clostridium tetanomorphum]